MCTVSRCARQQECSNTASSFNLFMNIDGEMAYCNFWHLIWQLYLITIECCRMSNVDKTMFRIEVVQCEESSANLKIALPKKLAPGGRTSWSILFGFLCFLLFFQALAHALGINQTIALLILDHNQIGDEGVKASWNHWPLWMAGKLYIGVSRLVMFM